MALTTIVYNANEFDIGYEIVNADAKIDMIILHGWGSNRGIMKQAFGLFLPNYRHIYIDLPGFGSSTCKAVLTTSDYARIVNLFLDKIGASKDIVAGHSFGGKVALLLNPTYLILLSSAGIYLPKSFKVKAKISVFKIFKALGLTRFRKLFIADDAKNLTKNMYETFKNVVNEDFSDYFKRCVSKTLICWGKDDKATPMVCAESIHEMIKDSKLVVFDGDHFFFLKHAKEIAWEIKELYNGGGH